MRILTNNDGENFKTLLANFSRKADCIKIASAFFSEADIIDSWLRKSKGIDLLVSLRPPTNYYSLKAVYSKSGINIRFLGREFHSKFIVFYNQDKPFAGIVGSSNFTIGGLFRNIETNVVFNEEECLTELEQQFTALFAKSYLLQQEDLDAYKNIFDMFQKQSEEMERKQDELQAKSRERRASKRNKTEFGREAREYFKFWRLVDNVKEVVSNISEKEYPRVPVYIAIDHFWHWVKTVWSKEDRPVPAADDRYDVIPQLFKEYCRWDKNNGNYTREMSMKSNTIFSFFLSKEHIDNVTLEAAKRMYENLHSGAMRARRFRAGEKFVSENSIEQIRRSLKYLIYSNDELDLRIHKLCDMDSPYKLKQLGSSGVQELVGWVNPHKYPIRNRKADDALRLLGFEL